MYTPIFLLLWYVGRHYMDVKVFGQNGGWGVKKKVFGYVDVIVSRITFHFNSFPCSFHVMTDIQLLYIDLYAFTPSFLL